MVIFYQKTICFVRKSNIDMMFSGGFFFEPIANERFGSKNNYVVCGVEQPKANSKRFGSRDVQRRESCQIFGRARRAQNASQRRTRFGGTCHRSTENSFAIGKPTKRVFKNLLKMPF